MTFSDKRGRKFTGRYALHGRVCDPKAGRCMTWDMSEKVRREASRTIDMAAKLYGARFYAAASEVADCGMELWGIALRLRKISRETS